jgi:hypothetical protein
MAAFFPALWQALRRPRPARPRQGGRRRLPLFECLEARQLLSLSVPGALIPRAVGADPYLVNVQPGAQPVLQVSADNGATFTGYTAPAAWDPSSGVALLGGAGTLRAAPDHPGTLPDSLLVASADFNGDGKPDYALVLDNRISLLLSQADGSYRTSLTVATPAGGNILFLAAGDFNGDGRTDLATVSRLPGQAGLGVDVLLGAGAGAFRTQVDMATGPQVFAVTVGTSNSSASLLLGNLNGDDSPELVLTRRDPGTAEPQTTTFIGTADGTFQDPTAPDPATSAPDAGNDAGNQAGGTSAGAALLPPPAATPAAVPDPIAPGGFAGAAGTAPALGAALGGSAPANFLAVGSVSGDTSLPIEVLVAPAAGSDSSDPAAGIPLAADDAAAAVNLVVRVDDAGTGDFESTAVSLTALHADAGTARGSTPAAVGSDPADAGGPAGLAASPSTAVAALGPAGKRENGSDPSSSRPAALAESASITAPDAVDAAVFTSFGALTALGDRGEPLPGPVMGEGVVFTAVTEPGREVRPAAPAAEEDVSEAATPGQAGADPTNTPVLVVLPLDRAADAAFWSRLDLGLALGEPDGGLAHLRPTDKAPAAAEGADVKSSLLKVGSFLAQAFYLQKLQAAGAAETAAGATQAATDVRLQVAEVVREAAVEATRLVRGFYERFLGRAAAGGEEQGWVSMLLGGQTEEQVLSAFLSTEEFGRRASALVGSLTADEAFVQALYVLLLLRAAADEEVASWLTALPTQGRRGVAFSLLRSVEYRRRQVESYYRELLQRDADDDEAADWAATPFDLRRIRELLRSRPEGSAVQ